MNGVAQERPPLSNTQDQEGTRDMPIQYRWYNDAHTVMVLEYDRYWTWEELYAAQDETNALVEQRGQPVTIIQDWRKSPDLPLNAIAHARNLVRRMHPNVKTTVYVGMSALVTTLWNTVVRMNVGMVRGRQFILVKTMDEAEAIVEQKLRETA
jgi:hypothetical protein